MSQEPSGVEHFFRTDDAGPGGAGSSDPSRMAASASLGASLRALREARRWSQADVSARLKFGVRQIDALESENWDDLPQGPSLRGLVRNYARLLEVDPDTLMNALPAHLQHRPAAAPGLSSVGGELPHATLRYRDGSASRRPVWPKVVLGFILICLAALAAYLIFEWWLPRNAADVAQDGGVSLPLAMQSVERALPAEESDAAVRPEAGGEPGAAAPAAEGRIAAAPGNAVPGESGAMAVETPGLVPAPGIAIPGVGTPGVAIPGVAQPPGVASPMAPLSPGATVAGAPPRAPAGPTAEMPATQLVDDPSAPAPTAVLGNVLGFNVTAASWVEVRDASGSVVLSSTLQPGAREQLDVATPVRIVIGNAGGVTLTWRGSPVDLASHQRGNVARLTLE